MQEHALPSLVEIERALASAEIGVDGCELHGSICGVLCAGGRLAGNWLETLAIEGPAPSAGDALERLREASHQQLGDPDCGFDLLLPEDSEGLGERIEALGAWCRGFLGGYGLGAGQASELSADAREALEDVARIAQADLSFEEGDEDENALAEIIEFVRVAVLLVHGEAGRRGPLH